MRPLLLLTRPLPQARQFARQMQADGPPHDVHIAPLSEIVPVAFDPAVFNGARGLVLTSVNAVPRLAQVPGLTGLPAFCVGPATTLAAQQAGFDARDCGGDAVRMIDALKTLRPAGPLVHAHGIHLARDLVAALTPEGLTLRSVPVYEARGVAWSPDTLARLTARPAGQECIVPLFSPRAALRFVQQLQGVRPKALRMIAISAACAANLPEDLRSGCQIARTPDADGMMGAILDAMSQPASDDLRQAVATDK